MSARSNAIPPVPRETAFKAKAAFDHNNFYIQAGENWEVIFRDIQLECLSGAVGDPMVEGTALPLITFFQFIEDLNDAQAVDALRTRLEWKFALHLPVNSLAFRQNTLCEFRQRALADSQCQREYQYLLDRLFAFDPPLYDRFHDFKNLDVVSAVCSINHFSRVEESIRQALEELACKYPEWLRKAALPHWYGRYNPSAPGFKSVASPHRQENSIRETEADIHHLLEEAHRSGLPEIHALQEIEALDRVLELQFGRPNQDLNAQSMFECNFCIYRERSKSSVKNQ